jgi:hypothetical protein
MKYLVVGLVMGLGAILLMFGNDLGMLLLPSGLLLK